MPHHSLTLEGIFYPRTVALIGASEKIGSVGRSILENLQKNTFCGTIYPINPQYEWVLGSRAYSSVQNIPEHIDLAIIVTPAATVPKIIAECAASGVTGAIIISAGFRECGSVGMDLEKQIQELRGTMRIIGPNCLGVMLPHTGLNATFALGMAKTGQVAFLSQSGALCTAILDWSLHEQVGFSAFVSVGSMLDVSWGDLIDYFGNDPQTKSIVCYMESIGNARAFLSAAREVSFTKPIIVIKVGHTEAAAKAAASHTGALTGSDAVLDAVFRRVGVLRVGTIEELFDMAEVLAKQPRPHGPRLAIVTNAGGPGALATDSLVISGGKIAPLALETRAALDNFLPAAWSHDNPIDILGAADAGLYARSVEIALKDPNTDGVLVVLTPQSMTDPEGTAREIAALVKKESKPVLASWMGGSSLDAARAILNATGIPTYDYPDAAARAFALMWRYSDTLRLLYERPSLPLEVDETVENRQAVSRQLGAIRKKKRTLLTEVESKELLAAYGIPIVKTRVAANENDAVRLAEKFGYPVVLKLFSETITHKSDVGGVQLDLRNAAEVRRAWKKIEHSIKTRSKVASFEGVTVQPFVNTPGIELILGSTMDSQFGPVLIFGAGGKLVEVMQDRAIGIPPLSITLAHRLMEQTQIFRALGGVRGQAPVDLDSLAELLVRFSHLVVEQRTMIAEMDINPLLVSAEGLLALDARVVLHERNLDEKKVPALAIRPYPVEYTSHASLKHGLHVTLRPIRPEDEEMLEAFHSTLSEETVAARYFSTMPLKTRIQHERLSRICFADYDREIALVAVRKTGSHHEIIAVGRINRLPCENAAEFALVVSDAWQNFGLGNRLLNELLTIARTEKLSRIIGSIRAGNTAMLHICSKVGFRLQHDTNAAEFKAEFLL